MFEEGKNQKLSLPKIKNLHHEKIEPVAGVVLFVHDWIWFGVVI